ncbi:MAG: hypothetical protein ACFCU9_14805 [Cyanophyceae cyanobacterium]
MGKARHRNRSYFMAGLKSPPPIVYIVAVLLLAGGGWYYFHNSGSFSTLTRQIPGIGSGPTSNSPSPQGDPSTSPTDLPTTSAPATNQTATTPTSDPLAALETTLPNPAVIRVDDSVTKVGLAGGLNYLKRFVDESAALWRLGSRRIHSNSEIVTATSAI